MLPTRAFFLSLISFVAVNATPVGFSKRQSITALTTAQIDAFTPFTHFASTAYCNPSTTINWSCGANCNANPDFIPVASGGDGGSVQFWYVGYSPSQASVIVAHQGTNTSNIEAIATDADAVLESLDPTLFPGISTDVEAHSGFANEQAKTATEVLSAVQSAISQHGATKVTVIGHSLGGAIAVLDGVYLPLHVSGVTFELITYGCPRVGNPAFADYIDAHISYTHITNMKDPVPIVPGRSLGYAHPNGEDHISEDSTWFSCPGHDNPSTDCIVGDVPNIFDGDTSDHGGPYNGITMGC